MTRADLDTVLEWRNRPDVRANMYTNHVISCDEHSAWWGRTEKDTTKRYFVFVLDGAPSGVIAFTEISERHRTATWAFYSSNPQRRGIGTLMEEAALDYAFRTLGLEKLSCEVLGFNTPVVKFHRKFGFRVEGLFRKQYLTDDGYTDVFRLALFRKDWEAMRAGPSDETLKPGAHFTAKCAFTHDQVRAFAAVTGDANPVHLDDSAAKAAGFAGTIAHGLLVGSVFSKILGMDFPGPGTVYRTQDFSFLRPVTPGQPLTAEVRVLTRIGNRLILQTRVLDQERNPVIEGEAEVVVRR
jgi:UDP-4-amino-4,6-dideoxy-N-acetyl-beta-L-altrosamine N-acetyltransferase